MENARILWRRLSGPGHDICTLTRLTEGWQLDGTAIWKASSGHARFDYSVLCNLEWRSYDARISGYIGAEQINMTLKRTENRAWINGDHVIPDSENLTDIDLGFTPATNTPTLRRLREGNSSPNDFSVLWLDDDDWKLKPLRQIYTRKAEGHWGYSSPEHNFQSELIVNAHGFITDYPGLWIEEV